jgi:hypothetical protein
VERDKVHYLIDNIESNAVICLGISRLPEVVGDGPRSVLASTLMR